MKVCLYEEKEKDLKITFCHRKTQRRLSLLIPFPVVSSTLRVSQPRVSIYEDELLYHSLICLQDPGVYSAPAGKSWDPISTPLSVPGISKNRSDK